MKKKIIGAVCAVLILIAAVCGAKIFHSEQQIRQEETPYLNEQINVSPGEDGVSHEEENEEANNEQQGQEDAEKENTEQNQEIKDGRTEKTGSSCTLSVRCDTALLNKDELDSAKAEILPENGVIFPETEVYFSEGESVYDVLLREMMNAKIHMESENTPMYQSAYIEGIANLYEYDCGPLSGWMYKVNGEFPNIGCSAYKVSDGDRIEWVYTCDLGADVGNENS